MLEVVSVIVQPPRRVLETKLSPRPGPPDHGRASGDGHSAARSTSPDDARGGRPAQAMRPGCPSSVTTSPPISDHACMPPVMLEAANPPRSRAWVAMADR